MDEKETSSKNKKLIKEETKKKSKKTKKERKIEKELLLIAGFMGFLVLMFFFVSSVFKSLNNFEYQGLEFKKERVGEIPVYHYSYYFKDAGGKVFQYNLYLRYDPRENNVTVEGGDIEFSANKKTFITLNETESLQQCRESVLAIAGLTSFLTDNRLSVGGGNADFWEAGRKGQEWITCENKPSNVVINIAEGDETKIKINGKCHEITVANCEILQATERYEIESILDAKKSGDI